MRGELLAALARCKVVGRLGVGLDNIDVAGLRRARHRGHPGGRRERALGRRIRDRRSDAAAARRYRASDDVIAGRWPREALSNGREIGGKPLGLVGFGSIGRVNGGAGAGVGMA